MQVHVLAGPPAGRLQDAAALWQIRVRLGQAHGRLHLLKPHYHNKRRCLRPNEKRQEEAIGMRCAWLQPRQGAVNSAHRAGPQAGAGAAVRRRQRHAAALKPCRRALPAATQLRCNAAGR